jgi:hypothetical protein
LLLAKSHLRAHLLLEASVSEADTMSSIHGDTMSTPDRLLANPSTPRIGAEQRLVSQSLIAAKSTFDEQAVSRPLGRHWLPAALPTLPHELMAS